MRYVILFAALLLGFVSCKSDEDYQEPRFTLEGYNTEDFSSNRMQGKRTFLYFFSPYCNYCKQNLPKMLELWGLLKSENGKKIEFLAITGVVDSDMSAYVMPVYLDKKSIVGGIYEVTGVPACYIVGPTGEIEWFSKGAPSLSAQKLYDKMMGN